MSVQVRRKKKKKSKFNAALLFTAVCLLFLINILMAGNKEKTEPVAPAAVIVEEEQKQEAVYYPETLKELLERNPETKDFVEGYSKRLEITEKGLTNDDINGEFPHFLQWDKRWGYDTYGEDMIAISGCGPTCVSMVATALTQNIKYSPLYTAEYAEKAGYIEGGSTSWRFMSEGAAEFGLSAEELPLDYNTVVNRVAEKQPVIVSVKPGDFTTVGHFIVIYGVTEEGRLKIKDPNSIIRSNKEWDWETVKPQIKNLWAYKKL